MKPKPKTSSTVQGPVIWRHANIMSPGDTRKPHTQGWPDGKTRPQ